MSKLLHSYYSYTPKISYTPNKLIPYYIIKVPLQIVYFK